MSTEIDGVDYGPLAVLPGKWSGDRGVDRAPEPHGEERNPYFETIVFTAAGDVENAESQVLAVVRYHQQVSRKSNGQVFHDQVGYWLWNSADNTLIETFAIPRGVAVVACGVLAAPEHAGDEVVFEVQTDAAAADSGVVQTAFMRANAKTTAFRHRLTVCGDEMRYQQGTTLDIYDKKAYDHTDLNTLTRVSGPAAAC